MRRWLGRLAVGVLVALGVVLLLVSGAWVFLSTSPGQAWLRGELERRIDAAIAGSVQLDGIEVLGNRVVLRGVSLRDPEGAVVARVDQAEVDWAPFALLKKRLQFDRITVVRPEVSLARDPRGTNLARAIAPRHPKPKQENPPGQRPFAIRVDALVIHRGAVSLRTEGKGQPLVLAGLDATGSAEDGHGFMDVELRFAGTLEQPTQGPVLGLFRAHRSDDAWNGVLRLEGPELRLMADLTSEGGRTHLVVEDLRVSPDLAQAVLPSWPLRTEVRGRGALAREGPALRLSLSLGAGSASVVVEGDFNTQTFTSRGLQVAVRHLNLAQLVPSGPGSDIAMDVHFVGGGRSLDALNGVLTVTAPPTQLEGARFGPVLIDARARDGRVSLRTVGVEVPGIVLRAEGQVSSAQVEVSGTLVARDLGAFARTLGRLAGPKGLALEGNGRAKFRLHGPTRNPTLTVDGKFPVLKWQQHVSRGVDLHLEVPDLGLRLKQLRAGRSGPTPTSGRRASPGMRAWQRGAQPAFVVPAQQQAPRPPRPIELQIQVEDLGLADLLKRLGLDVSVEGVTEATVRLLGPPTDPGIDLRIRLNRFVAPEIKPLDLSLTAKSAPGGRITLSLATTVDDQPSNLTVRLPWSLGRLLKRRPEREEILGANFDIEGDIRRFPVPWEWVGLGDRVGRPGGLRGTPRVTGKVDLRGELLRPRGTLDLQVTDIGGGALPPLEVISVLKVDAKSTHLEARLLQNDRTLAKLVANAAAAPNRLRTILEKPEVPLEAALELGPFSLLDLSTWATWFRPEHPLNLPADAIITGQLQLSGSLAQPRFQGRAALFGLTERSEARPGDVMLRASYADRKLEFGAQVASPTGGSMDLSVTAPVELSVERIRAGISVEKIPLEGRVVARDVDPSFLSGLTPAVRRVGGRLSVDAQFAGLIGNPDLRGELRWEDGVLELASYGSYRDVSLLAHGDRNRLVIEHLSATAGNGKGSLSGTLTRTESREQAYALEATARLDRFPVMNQDRLVANVTADATATGQVSPNRVELNPVHVSHAKIALPSTRRKNVQALEPPKNVTFVRNGQPVPPPGQPPGQAPKKEREAQRKMSFAATIDAPHNVLLVGEEFNLEVALGQDFRVEAQNKTEVFGTVRVVRGTVTVLGRDFKLQEDSQVSFTGPPTRPELNVTATHVNSREDVEIRLTVRGRPPHLQIVTSSNPPMSETEIYTLLATGRRAGQPGTTAPGGGLGASAVSVISSFIAGRLEQGIAEFVPIDYLRIQPGAEGFTGTRIETGRQITERLFLGLQSQIGADVPYGQNRNQLELDYQLSRRLVLELVYGDARVGTFDLLWRKRY